jgi:hypothetical protein
MDVASGGAPALGGAFVAAGRTDAVADAPRAVGVTFASRRPHPEAQVLASESKMMMERQRRCMLVTYQTKLQHQRRPESPARVA